MAIRVLTALSYSAEFLPQFAEHYAAAGAESIECTVLELVEGVEARALELTRGASIPVNFHPATKHWQETKIEGINKAELMASLGVDHVDATVFADLDEFHNFERPLPALIADMNASGYRYAMGRFVDRISESGELTAFDPKCRLDSQYPRGAHITRDICQIDDRKVVLALGHWTQTRVTSGHHRMIDESLPKYPHEFTIAHYAWYAGRLEAIERRVKNYEIVKNGQGYMPAVRLFKHLAQNGGRFNLRAA